MPPFGFSELEVRSIVVLGFAGASLTLVNQIEQPFARSLVTCDTPLNGTFTGSLHCGDRLYVIGRGAVISGNGQSLELFCKIITTFVMSYVADSIGRKSAAILGTGLALVSVVLFVIASQVRSIAPYLFVLAQGLQGCNGIDVVSRTIAGDIMLQSDDSIACAKRGQIVSTLIGLLCFFLSMAVLSAEISDFTTVWLAMLVGIGTTMLLVLWLMPETIGAASKEKAQEQKGIVGIVKSEAHGYYSLLAERPYVRWTAFELLFGGIADAVNVIIAPFMMARFGMGQFQAAISLIPAWILGLLFLPLVPNLAKAYGNRRVYTIGLLIHFHFTVLMTPFMGNTIAGIPMPIVGLLVLTPFSGVGAIVDAFRTRLVGAQNLSKFAVITTGISMTVGTITSFVYSHLFVAEAKTRLEMLAPFIMATIFRVLSYGVFFIFLRPHVLGECDKITAEEHSAAKAAQEKKAD